MSTMAPGFRRDWDQAGAPALSSESVRVRRQPEPKLPDRLPGSALSAHGPVVESAHRRLPRLRLEPRHELPGDPAAGPRRVPDVAPGEAVDRLIVADDVQRRALGHRLQARAALAGLRAQDQAA